MPAGFKNSPARRVPARGRGGMIRFILLQNRQGKTRLSKWGDGYLSAGKTWAIARPTWFPPTSAAVKIGTCGIWNLKNFLFRYPSAPHLAAVLGIDTDEHSPVYAKRALTAYGDSDVSDVSEYLQLLCDLEGLWYDRKNNNLMCHIREGVLIWMWPCQVAGEVRAMPPNTIQLELDDHIHIGVFTADAQASIVWNDGDIWLRKGLRSPRIESEIHRAVVARDPRNTNFLEYRSYKIIYRRYAGMFFIFCVDMNDNEMGMLDGLRGLGDGHDACTRTGTVGAKRSYALEASTSHRQELIHLFVEVLDGYFGNVCELDLVFHFDKVYRILDELLLAGEISETSTRTQSARRNIITIMRSVDKMD
eukprot:s1354_g2.t1